MAKKDGRRSFREITEQLKAEKALQPPPKPYRVTLTESASKVYLELEERNHEALKNDDPTNQHCTSFRMVDEAIRTLIPSDPANKKYALHAPLTDLYRISKGRTRIAWVVDTTHREILIVYISDTPRKEGDKNDPYVVLNAMAKAGYLKTMIEDWRKALEIPPDSAVH